MIISNYYYYESKNLYNIFIGKYVKKVTNLSAALNVINISKISNSYKNIRLKLTRVFYYIKKLYQ